MNRPLIGIVLLALCASVASAQSIVEGRIVDDAGAPIGGATVTVSAIGYSVRTDSLGAFKLSGTPGSTLGLTIRAPGFRVDTASIVLARRGTVQREITLTSENAPLPEANPSDRLLRGRVTDSEGVPLSYANIQFNGGVRRIVSDDSGRFNVPVAEGALTLLVRRIGFEPEEITLAGMPDTAIQVRMTAVPTVLPEQRITGRAAFVSLDMRGFYRRMRDAEKGINHGYFVTPEDFAQRNPANLTQMVENYPTVRVQRSPRSPIWDVIRGPRNCTMPVYVDGIQITAKMNGSDDFVNMIAPVNHVAAMEIYPRLINAPPEYQSLKQDSRCGVVLIWTK
jgi:hypothetical protein